MGGGASAAAQCLPAKESNKGSAVRPAPPCFLKTACENPPFKNSPSSAVALSCGMGSSYLNADVNAFERLQIVRGRNPSYRLE